MDLHLEIFRKITDDDVHAYELLFKDYYKFLCSYAFGLTKEKHSAEEIVEDFFVELWNNRKKIRISTSVRSYFISSVHNRCLNYLQREKQRFKSAGDIASLAGNEDAAGEHLIIPEPPSLLTNELENALARAIGMLPQSCREIFVLSRFNDMNYEEVAEKLNISVNTVKTQIKIALRKLREIMKDYLVIILLLLLK